MQLKALMRLVTGMTDNQCRVSNQMCGLRGGRELTITPVAKQASTGRSCTGDWAEKIPAGTAFFDRGPSCAGDRVIQAMANAWWWLKESATISWRRDLQKLVSSLVLELMGSTTISTHGAFSDGRVPVGRGQ